MDKIFKYIPNCVIEKREGKKEGEFVAWGSKIDVDRDNEIILPEGIDVTNYEKNKLVLFGHNHYIPAVGKAMWLKIIPEEGLKFGFKFATGDDAPQLSKDLNYLYKEGIMNSFSVGFIGKKYIDNPGDTKGYEKYAGVNRIWTEVELLEISCVNVPANAEARVLEISKSLAPEADRKELFEMISKCASGEMKEEVVEEEIEKEGVIDTTQEEIKIEETIVEEKDGRVLSKKNRALIQDCVAKLMDSISALDTLLKATEEVLEENAVDNTVTEVKDVSKTIDEEMENALKEVLTKKEDKDVLTKEDFNEIGEYLKNKHKERMTEQEMKRKGKVFI